SASRLQKRSRGQRSRVDRLRRALCLLQKDGAGWKAERRLQISSRQLPWPMIPTLLKDDMSLDKARSTRFDVALLYIARGVRGLGDGFAIILLPAYLSAIGFGPGQIGIILSASLLGTALLTLAVGFIAPRHDLRNFMLGGALLMACTGLAFPSLDVF